MSTSPHGSTISYVQQPPQEVQANDPTEFAVDVQVGDEDGEDHDVDVTIALYVGGTKSGNIATSEKTTVPENELITAELTHSFSPAESGSKRVPVFVKATVDYFGSEEDIVQTETNNIVVTQPEEETGETLLGDDLIERDSRTTYQDAYEENHVEFVIANISYEDDAPQEASSEINFEYKAPAISSDTSGRFATHEILGGSTVRQKIGEAPMELEITGVCKESKARQLDTLRDAKFGTILSNRLPGKSLDVHFASISTSPLEDGGAVAIGDFDGEFLYTFDLSAVEVTR